MLPIGWDKLLPPVRFRSVGIYALYLVENLIGAVRLVLVLVVCVFPTCYASSVEVITVLSPRVDFPAFRRMVDSLSALSSAFSFEKGKGPRGTSRVIFRFLWPFCTVLHKIFIIWKSG